MAKPDKATLVAYVEELALPDETKASLLRDLEADETRATNFVGQRLRQSDYTRKTQELADQRKQLDTAVSQQVREYAEKLQEADNKVASILKDLESEKISRATAETRLQRVAKQYEIPDEDIRTIVTDNQNGGGNNGGGRTQQGEGLTEKHLLELLAKRDEDLIKRLMPDLMAFPRISAIQQQIRDDHFELTGKRMTAKEMDDLQKAASDDPEKAGLYKAWEDKYEIGKIRMDRHDKEVSDKAVAKYAEDQKRKASEDAIAGIHTSEAGRPLSTSPVVNRRYQNRAEDDAAGRGNGNGNGKEKQPEPRMSGAERAAVKYMERRNQGIPLGKEAPVK